MNRLPMAKRVAVVAALVEGNSIRSTVRMTGVSKNTITKLLVELGAACADYQHKTLINLPCKRVQADEIWSFVGAKDKNVPADRKGAFGIGSVWTWTALCADTKLMVSWLVADRSAGAAFEFMYDVASRLRNRVQLTTDGNTAYLWCGDRAKNSGGRSVVIFLGIAQWRPFASGSNPRHGFPDSPFRLPDPLSTLPE